MADRTRTHLDTAVGEQVAAHGRVLPPWRAYPGESPYSLCWRMGGGEWHIMVWGQWWDSACPDEAMRLAYFAADQPPTDWLGWAAATIWPEADEDEAVRHLSTHGVGDHAIWRAWLDALESSTGRPVLFLDVSASSPAPALLHRVDPHQGLTGADLDVIERWLAEPEAPD